MADLLSKFIVFLLCLFVYPDVAHVFGYMGFKIEAFAVWRVVASLLVIFVLNLVSKDAFSKIATLFLLIPTLTMFCYGVGQYLLLNIAVFFLFYFLSFRLVRRRFGPNFLLTNKIIVLVLLPIFLGALFVFRDVFSLSNLLDVYGNREEYKAAADTQILGYVKGIVKIGLVLLTAFSLIQRRYFLYACLTSAIFFGVFSSKYMLIMPVLLIATYYAMQRPNVLLGFTFSAFILFLLLKSVGQEFLFVTVIRRALFLHSLLAESYLQLYEIHGAQYFLNDALSFLGLGKINVVYEAGLNIYGDLESHANTGFLGASIIQFGPNIGPLLYGVFYGFWFALFFGGARAVGPSGLVATYLAIQAVLISDLPQVMLLHGGILLSILLRVSDDRVKGFSKA